MSPNLWLYLLVGAAAAAFGLLIFRRHRRRAAPLETAEEGLPHLCRPGTFHVEPSILVRNVSQTADPHFVHVFDALFCSVCGAELVCMNCRGTPGNGALLNHDEMRRLTRCCPAPRYRARKPAKLRVVSSPSTGSGNDDDSGNLSN